MRVRTVSVMLLISCICAAVGAPLEDGKKALSVRLGNWETGLTTRVTSLTVKSKVQCQWSPLGEFMFCDQVPAGKSDQPRLLTVFSYDSKANAYTYAEVSNAGVPPLPLTVEIKGGLWIYSWTFNGPNGKIMLRTTLDLSVPGVERIKGESSSDGGENWRTTFEGTGKKVSEDAVQPDEATKKLGAFLGKWQSQGTFAGGEKVTANLECRWSPKGTFLVCEQIVHMSSGDTRQLTVYFFDAVHNTYGYTTISNPGAKPTSGVVDIQGDVWAYDSSYEADGKTVEIRNINEFTDAKTEAFTVVSSEDGGAHWKKVLEGSAKKIGD
jgi:hypothetical protein